MLPIRKILCPTDFSEPSYEAIKTAGELAFHFDAELCLLHVVPPVPMIPMGEGAPAFDISLYEQELESTSKRTLQEIINHLEWKDLMGRLIVLRGNAAEEIIRTAQEEKVDLIVIATRGRTGLDRFIFGSVAEKVVRLATCPVLIVTGSSSERIGEKEEVREREETSKNRKAFIEKVEAELKEWGLELDVFKAKVEKSKEEVKMKYLEQVQELKRQQEVLREKLNDLKESGDEAWGDFKEGVEEALKDMKEALKRAASRFKKP